MHGLLVVGGVTFQNDELLTMNCHFHEALHGLTIYILNYYPQASRKIN